MTCAKIFTGLASPLSPEPTDAKTIIDPLPGIRAVFFDVYGTLIISSVGDISLVKDENRDAVMARCLAAYGFGIPHDNRDGISKRFREIVAEHQAKEKAQGTDWPEVEIRFVWRDLISSYGFPEAEIETCEHLATYYEAQVNAVWPMPNALTLLEKIQERGLCLGIVSNAQFFTPHMFTAFFDKDVETLGFQPEHSHWSFAHLKAKPSTALYENAAEALASSGISPEEVLYIGNDMRNDVAPAHKVGFKTVLFAGDARSLRWREGDSIVGDIQPDRVVTDLIQILDILGG
ncbi:MAG: HAD family hydrolase [Opitutales bacterium]